ncbi:MAG TPA: hypothetical protein VG826_14755 [Pirellulales bacterium]|nr:hypothetical protein [Pirellulales bacterium]
MGNRRSWQFGLKALITCTTFIAIALGVHVCPRPIRPVMFKAVGGIALFVPLLVAVYASDWLERWQRRR